MRLVADTKHIGANGPQRIPGIEVMVRRVIQPCRNQMNVDVEEQIAHGFHDQTRFL